MSLFQNTSALGITPDDIGGCHAGSSWRAGVRYGFRDADAYLTPSQSIFLTWCVLPAWPMVRTYGWEMPRHSSQEGKATIQTAICTRDDIMIYLIHMGLEQGLSFTIMESVRKGKGLKPEWDRGNEGARCA